MNKVYKYNWDRERLMKEELDDIARYPEFVDRIHEHYSNMYQVFNNEYYPVLAPNEDAFDLSTYLKEQLELFNEYKERLIKSLRAKDELRMALYFLEDGMYFPPRNIKLDISDEVIVDTCKEIYSDFDKEIYDALYIPLNEENYLHFLTCNNPYRSIIATCHNNHSNNRHYISLCKEGNLKDIVSFAHELYHHYEASKVNTSSSLDRLLYLELGSTYMSLEACDFLERKGYNKEHISDVREGLINALVHNGKDFYLSMQMLNYLSIHPNQLDGIIMNDITRISSYFVSKCKTPLKYFDAYNIKRYQYLNGFAIANTLRMDYSKKDQIRILKEISTNMKCPLDVLKDNEVDLSIDNHLNNVQKYMLTL